MTSLRITGDLLKEGTAMMTTGKRAMVTVVMVTEPKWSFQGREKTVGEVQTGAADQRVDDIGLSMTEDGLPPDTRAGIEAGKGIVTEKVGDPSHLTGTGKGLEADQQAETGNAVAGRRRRTGGQRLPRG